MELMNAKRVDQKRLDAIEVLRKIMALNISPG